MLTTTRLVQARRGLPGAFVSLRALALVALTALVACSGGERAVRSGPSWLTEKVQPRNLRLTLDTGAAEARIVTPRGATFSAMGEDGTLYTLTIPKGALARDTRITLIPVRAMSGLPFGGATPAVQLKPEGLRLLKPATLIIEPDKPVPPAEQVAFAYLGSGEDAHLYSARGDSLQVELKLLHFSGYGFGKAPPGDPGVEMLQKAAAQEARLEAKVAWLIRVAKRQMEAGDDDAEFRSLQRVEQVFIEYYDAVVRPLMQVAEEDDRMAECAAERFLVWARQMALLGSVGAESEEPASKSAETPAKESKESPTQQRYDEGWTSLGKIWENAMAKAMPRADAACRERHDFRAYNRVIALERSGQLIGWSKNSAVVTEVLEHLEACMNFEVELVSVIENKTRTGRSSFHVAATVPFSVPFSVSDSKDNHAPLRYVEFTASGRPMEELFGKYQKSADGDDFVRQGIRGMAELGNVEMSAAGTRNGTLRVLELRTEPDTVEVAATGCRGEDTKEKAAVDSTWQLVLEVESPVELTRFRPLHVGQPFTDEMHEWMRFFRQFRSENLTLAPGQSNIHEMDGGTQQLIIQVKLTEPGTWRAELSTPAKTPAPGYSLSENGHLVLRHTPKPM
jgi:hypothetical protein